MCKPFNFTSHWNIKRGGSCFVVCVTVLNTVFVLVDTVNFFELLSKNVWASVAF